MTFRLGDRVAIPADDHLILTPRDDGRLIARVVEVRGDTVMVEVSYLVDCQQDEVLKVRRTRR
jgi:hypothetical protein